MQIKVSWLEYENTYIGPSYVAQLYAGTDTGGVRASLGPNIYIFWVFIYFISVAGPLSKT